MVLLSGSSGQGKKFFHKNSEFVASICLDITDTIELQQELSELTHNIPGGVCKILMDQDFTLLYGNDSFYQLYGYTSAEMQTQLGNKLIARSFLRMQRLLWKSSSVLTEVKNLILNLNKEFFTRTVPYAIF